MPTPNEPLSDIANAPCAIFRKLLCLKALVKSTHINPLFQTLHNNTARILFLGLLVEHFALRTQAVTLRNQIINLLSSL
jgi:hypothetical protein